MFKLRLWNCKHERLHRNTNVSPSAQSCFNCTEVTMRPLQLLSISSFSRAMQTSVRNSRLRLLTGGLCMRITATPAETQRQWSFTWMLQWSLRQETCDGDFACFASPDDGSWGHTGLNSNKWSVSLRERKDKQPERSPACCTLYPTNELNGVRQYWFVRVYPPA